MLCIRLKIANQINLFWNYRAKSIKIQKKETAKIYSRLKVLKVHLIILREVIEMYFIIDFNSINLFYNVNPKI